MVKLWSSEHAIAWQILFIEVFALSALQCPSFSPQEA